VKECLGYFKITPGTGLTGKNLPCHCPYCGHKAGHNHFWTREQLAYGKSFAFNRITAAVLKDLKALEFNHRPRGSFGIGFSMKVEGRPHPIRYYREKQLETEVVCDRCTLRYAIYGVFGFCPDCGVHNSISILNKNLELADKEIALAATVEGDLAQHLIGDALENAVSAFDGFGRETCRVSAGASAAPASKPKKLSFQNLSGARTNVQENFGFDLASGLAPEEWALACQCFQKRHLLAHKLGVVDDDYVKATNDPEAVVGRKVRITPEQVKELIAVLHKIGAALVEGIKTTS
jgi:hypothetical protein